MCLKFCPILYESVSGIVKEMSKFPGVGNVYTMNKKCAYFMRFPGLGNLGFLPVRGLNKWGDVE